VILVADGKLAVGVPDADDRAVENVAGEQGAPDPGLDLPADEPAQRPRPVDRVVALLGDEAPGIVGDLQLHLPLAEPGPQIIEHEVDDALGLGLGQGLEQHDVVEAVQELGPNGSAAEAAAPRLELADVLMCARASTLSGPKEVPR
jgi:hypothetical protein